MNTGGWNRRPESPSYRCPAHCNSDTVDTRAPRPRRGPGSIRRLIEGSHGCEIRQIRQQAVAIGALGVLKERQVAAVIAMKCVHGSRYSVPDASLPLEDTFVRARGKAAPTSVAIARVSHYYCTMSHPYWMLRPVSSSP